MQDILFVIYILILLSAVYTTLSFSLNLLCFAAATIFGFRLLSVQNILPIIPMRKSNSFVFIMLLLKPIHKNHRNHKISICNISFVFKFLHDLLVMVFFTVFNSTRFADCRNIVIN